jgi:anhydro-N-acetylmuramic acid kinase
LTTHGRKDGDNSPQAVSILVARSSLLGTITVMPTRWVIGLAAGPCLTGVDAALLEVEGRGTKLRVQLRHTLTQAHDPAVRELLAAATTPGRSDARQLARAHRLLAEGLATAARLVADQASVSLQQVLCVGCDSLTTGFEPEGRSSSLIEIAAPAIIAEKTGLTTLTDFRWRDLAAGGQAGPIGALADLLLFGTESHSRLHVHLGGIAQVVLLPRDGTPRTVLGWDAGPCLVLLNALMQELSGGKELADASGRLAVQGRQIQELLHIWLQHPFLLRRPPKSLARSAFAEEFARHAVRLTIQKSWAPHDLLCTANHLVARSISEGVKRYLPRSSAPESVVLSGRGARSGLLWRLLEDQLPGIALDRSDSLGIPAEAIESVWAGVLACLTLDGEPANLPTVTGARGARILGSLTPGSQSNWSRCLEWMTGHVYSAVGDGED